MGLGLGDKAVVVLRVCIMGFGPSTYGPNRLNDTYVKIRVMIGKVPITTGKMGNSDAVDRKKLMPIGRGGLQDNVWEATTQGCICGSWNEKGIDKHVNGKSFELRLPDIQIFNIFEDGRDGHAGEIINVGERKEPGHKDQQDEDGSKGRVLHTHRADILKNAI
jgi:hypothetical protein